MFLWFELKITNSLEVCRCFRILNILLAKTGVLPKSTSILWRPVAVKLYSNDGPVSASWSSANGWLIGYCFGAFYRWNVRTVLVNTLVGVAGDTRHRTYQRSHAATTVPLSWYPPIPARYCLHREQFATVLHTRVNWITTHRQHTIFLGIFDYLFNCMFKLSKRPMSGRSNGFVWITTPFVLL